MGNLLVAGIECLAERKTEEGFRSAPSMDVGRIAFSE
jgi:hypothetical protein